MSPRPLPLDPRPVVFLLAIVVGSAVWAADPDQPDAKPASPAARLVKLLDSGKLPPQNIPTVVGMVCEKGDADDLSYIYRKAADPNLWPADARLKVFDLLAETSANRKLKPSGDLSALKPLLSDPSPGELRLKAIRLAGLWKIASLAAEIESIARTSPVGSPEQNAAIESLGAIADEGSKAALSKLATKGQLQGQRYAAIAAWARFDPQSAAKAAAEALADASSQDNFAPLLDEFLGRQSGPDQLAAALADVKLDRDVARSALRYMFSVGHSDAALSNLLSRAADIPANPPLPTEEEIQALVPEVTAKGDATRGELVFRRADLSCLKCHSISKAGGQVGPELSAVGATSPPDYIVRSILNPDAQKKEQYETKVIVADGLQHVGIVIDRNRERVKIRDATGKVATIRTEDIEEERNGKSLMPEGITKFLTHQEFLDLAKFASELGRPGPYAVRTTPIIQRWRLLQNVPDAIAHEIPNVEQLRIHVLDSKPEDWSPVYAKVSGQLPLSDAIPNNPSHDRKQANSQTALYLKGEFEVTAEGPIAFAIDAPPGTAVWLDADPYEGDSVHRITSKLPIGTHTIILRVPIQPQESKPEASLKVELSKPAGSSAQFQPIGGP